MNQWIRSLTFCGAALAMSSVFGWGGKAPQTQEPYLSSDFPMNSDQQWFTKESYLFLKPYEDDNDYAGKLTTTGSLGSTIDMSMKLEKPNFDWFSGARIGVGRYLANHDKWDISLFTTYFYAQEDSSSSPNRDRGALLTPNWIPTFDGGATRGKTVWRLNFFNWDLSVGREYNMLKTIIAHPFIGLRAALIYKTQKSRYSDRFISANADRTLMDKFSASNSYWGIGPRTGVDLQFNMSGSWSLLGNLSGALFFGRNNLRESISTNVINGGALVRKKYNAKDNRFNVRANLDTGLGLGWEAWLKQHTVRIAPSVMFEASCWFDTNQLFVPRGTTSVTFAPDPALPNFVNQRRQGNLILMGVSFNLQADF